MFPDHLHQSLLTCSHHHLRQHHQPLDPVQHHQPLALHHQLLTLFVLKRVEHREKHADSFYDRLSRCGAKPVLLSLVPGYSAQYEPRIKVLQLPKPLSALYDHGHLSMAYDDLVKEAEQVLNSLKFKES